MNREPRVLTTEEMTLMMRIEILLHRMEHAALAMGIPQEVVLDGFTGTSP
jgi:hypothetical protein